MFYFTQIVTIYVQYVKIQTTIGTNYICNSRHKLPNFCFFSQLLLINNGTQFYSRKSFNRLLRLG